jgi:D-alanine-D-alanine ligase
MQIENRRGKGVAVRRIWVLCGGPSTEFDVSLSSARVVCEHIELGNQIVKPVVITRNRRWIVPDWELTGERDRGRLQAFFAESAKADAEAGITPAQALGLMLQEPVDCAMLALHGQFGEDGCIQGFLETAGVSYTGSRVFASALAFNKVLSIDVYRRWGLATADSIHASRATNGICDAARLKFPVFVKPVRGGSSVGMTPVASPDGLDAAIAKALETDSEVLIEEKVDGVEVSCGVLDLRSGNGVVPTAMPPTEIRPVDSSYFDYVAKYVPGKCVDITPAELSPAVLERIQACALTAHRALGCEGMSRTDMIVPDAGRGEPVILETNTIPGMTPTSLLPQQAAARGITFQEFLNGLIEHAIWRGTGI